MGCNEKRAEGYRQPEKARILRAFLSSLGTRRHFYNVLWPRMHWAQDLFAAVFLWASDFFSMSFTTKTERDKNAQKGLSRQPDV